MREANDLRRRNAIPPIAAGFVLASLPRSASAEVSDKVASMQDHWLFAIGLSTLAFALVRWRLWLLGSAAMSFLFVMLAEWESPGDDIGVAGAGLVVLREPLVLLPLDDVGARRGGPRRLAQTADGPCAV
jgi:hypothetical protein